MQETKRRFFKITALAVGIVVLVGMLLSVNVNRKAIVSELATLNLVPMPEKLTELYFDDGANLPRVASKGQVVAFAFVIHNLEASDYRYLYKVTVSSKDKKLVVDSGSVLVGDTRYYRRDERVKLLDLPGLQEIVVELTNKKQAIDFWVGEE
jgi:hypothetical protein